MAHRRLLLGLLLLLSACGGQVLGGSSGGTAAGTGGSTGTGGGGGTAGAATGGAAGQGEKDWTACGPEDSCVLEPVSCCGPPCEPVAMSWFTAINGANATAYQKSLPVCPCIASQCAPVPIGQASTPNYYATCEAGRCQVNDVRTSTVSACTMDADCTLRSGATCCGCGNDNLIAVSNKVDVEAVFCPPSAGCAADCSSSVPAGVRAACLAGHCAVVNWPILPK